jgi:asparagine synthetase B (glutamine-hydrolysing)
MPDLALHFDPRGLRRPTEVARRLETIVSGSAAYNVVRAIEPTIVAINALKPFSYATAQPFCRPDGWLMLDGALYGEAAFTQNLDALFSGQPDRVDRVAGQFNAISYRRDANELTVVTDRVGMRPLYYATDGRAHVIASEIKVVVAALGISNDLSPVGILELVAFGHNIQDRTVLERVSVLPAGTVFSFGAGGVTKRAYYRFAYTRSPRRRTAREWGESISDCLKTNVRKYLQGDGRKAIFLSGGLDSRFVAGAIARQGSPIQALTFGIPGSPEVVYAQEIARVLGMPHTVLTHSQNYLSRTLRKVVERAECAAPFFHTGSVDYHDEMALHADKLLVGFCGDILSGGHLKRQMFEPVSREAMTDLIFRRALLVTKREIATILNPGLVERHWAEFMESFRASVEAIHGQEGPDLADVWDMDNRQRRFTFSSPKVDRYRFEIIAPLLDRSFLDLMTTLPPHARWKQLAYRHAIVDGFPELSGIPWTKTDRPVRLANLRYSFDDNLRIARRSISRLGNKFGFSRARVSRDPRDLALCIRQDHVLQSEYLTPFATPGTLSDDYFNPRGIRAVVDEHQRGRDRSHLLGALLTVAEFHHTYLPRLASAFAPDTPRGPIEQRGGAG